MPQRRNIDTVISKYNPSTKTTKSLSENQAFVTDLLDTMQTPPAQISAEYALKCVRSAGRLRNPTGTDLVGVRMNVSSESKLKSIAFESRNSVFDVIGKIGSYILNSGRTAVIENPFAVIGQMNAKRVGFQELNVSLDLAERLVQSINTYLDLVDIQNDDETEVRNDAVQISSARISFEGFGSSGSPAIDLIKFVPELEMVRDHKTSELVSLFDFSKRVPKVLFTANYAPDGESRGSLVGWRRIADASGYVVTRRNVFSGDEVLFSFSNAEISDMSKSVHEYVDTWVLSFYDDIDSDSVYTFVDGTIDPNVFYVYTVQAVQNKRTHKGSVFAVQTSPGGGSPAQRVELNRKMELLDPGFGPDLISPYPILAQQFLGDSRLDWVLAGVNIRASVNRRESRSNSRSFSYLTAQMGFLLDQMVAGKFVVPKDVSEVSENVNNAIASFGVSQIMGELLRETGILYHFEGQDAKEDSSFDRIDVGDENGLLMAILSAADPETATIDLKALLSNLPSILNRVGKGKRIGSMGITATAQIEMLDVDRDDSKDLESSFVQSSDAKGDDQADLTTFDGLSRFMRAIRVFADSSVDRGAETERRETIGNDGID